MKSRRRAAERAQAAELTAIAEARSPDLLSFTVPIYQANSRDEPEVVGSAVLIALNGIRFLLTAGHVLDLWHSGQLAVGVAPEFLTLAGQPTRLRSRGSTTPEEDRIDVGIVRLGGGPWDALELDRFLPWSSLDTDIPRVARHTYALVGFPHSVNRKAIQGDRIKAAAYRMAGLESEMEAYSAEAVDPEHNVMVGFEKDAMWGRDGQRTAPDLYGASGSGLWRFGRRIRTSKTAPVLSAIATEWHAKGRHRYVLGTKITLILGALADRYDDVRAYVDQHRTSYP